MSEQEFQRRKEFFLSNEVILRMVRNIMLYQDIYTEKENEEERQILHERMVTVFLPKIDGEERGKDEVVSRKKWEEIMEEIIKMCENGKFSIEAFTERLAGSLVGEEMMRTLSTTNEIINYETDENSNSIKIHIKPSPTEKTSDLLKLIIDGFHKIALDLKNNKNYTKEINNIEMESWLLGPDFEDKIKALFGEGIELEDTHTKDSVEEISNLALLYNQRSLKEFLKSGKTPRIRRLTMSKEDFIKRFG